MSIPEEFLNADNYYSPESDWLYMSNSQYKSFLQCEAATMARLNGEWKEEPSEALLVGSYVHAAIEGTLDAFKAEHPELFSTRGETKGQLLAKYKQADVMVSTLQNDDFIQTIMSGLKEFPITAEFAGTTWKAKFDIYNPNKGFISDVKTVKNIYEKVWDATENRYTSWFQAYGYSRQLAIYTELERIWSGRDKRLKPLVIAVSKEEIPDKAVIGMDEESIRLELEIVEENMDHILAVKNGFFPPERCGKCGYCRSTKKITKIIDYLEL